MCVVYSADEASPMVFLAQYRFVILVLVWEVWLHRRNLPLIFLCPDQRAQSLPRYAWISDVA